MSKLSKLSRNRRTDVQKQKRANQPKRTEENRIRRRSKHMKRQPNDKQTEALL